MSLTGPDSTRLSSGDTIVRISCQDYQPPWRGAGGEDQEDSLLCKNKKVTIYNRYSVMVVMIVAMRIRFNLISLSYCLLFVVRVESQMER